jgi:hypothetical protein
VYGSDRRTAGYIGLAGEGRMAVRKNQLKEVNRLTFELLGIASTVDECAAKLHKLTRGRKRDLADVTSRTNHARAEVFAVKAEIDDMLDSRKGKK